MSRIKPVAKNVSNIFCLLLVFPFALSAWIEKRISEENEAIFSLWAHMLAMVPGMPGVFLRRGFYSLVLNKCSRNCHIGFGSVLTHRQTVIEDNVSIGLYAIIGSVSIGKSCEIGSRVSIVSGKHQHTRDSDGGWSAFDHARISQIHIAPNVWIGEGAVIMADIGEGSLVGAGSVVTRGVPANVVVAGNPAKVLKELC